MASLVEVFPALPVTAMICPRLRARAGPWLKRLEVLGPWGALMDDEYAPASARWARQFLQDRAMTIAGGTSEVQKNIVAQRILGLPRDRGSNTGK